MSQDTKLVDLGAERAKRVHDLNEKRLNEVRKAFEQAMPLAKTAKKPKNCRVFDDLRQLTPSTAGWPWVTIDPGQVVRLRVWLI
ncbi:hypothetical protein [Pseudomonas bubulae]|uniref:hypothetical protein n=1 Tax=Pseudomonas bubulae TaxID=2316085 RepID=UPI0030B4BE5B